MNEQRGRILVDFALFFLLLGLVKLFPILGTLVVIGWAAILFKVMVNE